jgi:hypothetical protein
MDSGGYVRNHQKQVAGVLAGAGLLLWLVHKAHYRPVEHEDEHGRVQHIEAPFFARASYWGTLLLITGCMVGAVQPLRAWAANPAFQLKVVAAEHFLRNLPNGTASFRSARTNTPPPLKMQGIFYAHQRPSAIINGQMVYVGDRVGGATVIAIDPRSVTIEISGKTQVLAMAK